MKGGGASKAINWLVNKRDTLHKMLCLSLFVFLVIFLQLDNYHWIMFWLVTASACFIVFSKEQRLFLTATILFGVGYYLFLHSRTYINFPNASWNRLLDRLLILLIIIFASIVPLTTKTPLLLFWNKPKWNHTIAFPWIWSGFYKLKIKHFLVIAIIINVLTFMPFYFISSIEVEEIIWLAFLFSLINAAMEELLWRGVLLSQFCFLLGERWAVVITSLGFGLQHYSLGFSWYICLFFALGGLCYGGMTVRSGSIIPAFLWHMVLNVLMIGTGIITFSA